MADVIRIALVGDYDPDVPAHQAIPRALALTAEATAIPVEHEWVPPEQITREARVAAYDAV